MTCFACDVNYPLRHQERKAKVEVKVALAYLTHVDVWVLAIAIVNDNDYAVRVNSTGLVMQDGTKRDLVVLHQMSGASLPGVVPAHDEGSSFLERTEAEQAGIDVSRPLIAGANLASIGRVESKPITVMKRS